MVDLQTAWRAPIRRIYLVWGVVMLVGFILSGYGLFDGYWHWYGLSLIGVLSQIIGMRLTHWKAQTLLGLWAAVSFGGTLLTHFYFNGTLPFPGYLYHIGFYWLFIMSLPQIFTGWLMKNKLQMGVGAIWLVTSLVFWQGTLLEPFYSFIFIALLSGLPYLYISFKK